MNIIQIILIAFVHAYAFNGQPSHVLWVPRFTPFAVAPVIGLILGDVKTATIVGAAVQTLNMAPMVVGGFASFDLWMAMTVAIPLVITANVDLETAVAVAAPVSALSGSLVNPLENAVGSAYVRLADKAAADGDAKRLFRVNLWGPMVFKFPVRFIIVWPSVLKESNSSSLYVRNGSCMPSEQWAACCRLWALPSSWQ